VSPGSELFDLERFDGDSSSALQILSAVMTMPFASKRKVVVVDRIDRLSADDQGKIAAFIPNLGAQSCLVMLAGDENPSKRRAGQQSKESGQAENGDSDQPRSKKGLQAVLTSAVRKHGVIIDFAAMKTQDVTTMIAESVRGQGKRVESSALQMLSYSLQSSPSLIDKEIEKLIAYVGERAVITASDVEQVTTRSPEDRVFPLIDAVAAGRAEAAARLLTETLAASTKPDGEAPKILALLGRHFRILYQVRYLVNAGVSHLGSVPENLRAELMDDPSPTSIKSDWQRQKFLEQAHHFTLDELRSGLKHILDCELAVKGQSKSSSSPRLSLEMLILKLSLRKTLA
jgi:DNA polymerase-3 subunit delta